MKITEKQIEDVFEIFHEKLVEPKLKLVARQFIFQNGRRADLIFEDKDNRKMIIELKRDVVTREDVGQLIEYRGILDKENPRIVLAAPIIPTSIKKSFEHFGIEYIEFSITKIEALFKKIENLPKEKISLNLIEKPSEIISEPLTTKRLIDGNIAFKVTFVDNNWSGVCSPDNADFNFKNRTWCKIQSEFEENCQSDYWKNEDNVSLEKGFPCHDCIALKELCFYPGHFHGPKHDNEPKRCLEAKQGKIAVFTSRAPGEPEEERFIFAICEIAEFIDVQPEDGQSYEIIAGNFEKSLTFEKGSYPKYWNYYRNPNAPERISWNTGLFRYLNDRIVGELLNDIKQNWTLDEKGVEICDYLIKKVE